MWYHAGEQHSLYSVSHTMRPWLLPRNAGLDRAGLPGSPKAEFDWGGLA